MTKLNTEALRHGDFNHKTEHNNSVSPCLCVLKKKALKKK